jgi:hypothetical protein
MTNIIALKAVNAHRWAGMHMRDDRETGLEPATSGVTGRKKREISRRADTR